jgi:hypothetical protein
MPAIVVTSNAAIVLLVVKSAADVIAVAVVVIDDANVVVVVAAVVAVVAVVPAGGSERPGCGVLVVVAHELAIAHVHIDVAGQIAQLAASIAVCRRQSEALTIDAGSENVPESWLFCVSSCVKTVLFVKGGIDVKKLSLSCSAFSFVKSDKLGTGPVIAL